MNNVCDDFDGCNPVSVRCLVSKKMKTGWIIQDSDGEFVDRHDILMFTKELRNALVFPTRIKARENKAVHERPFNREVVRRVELYGNGKIKKIIPGLYTYHTSSPVTGSVRYPKWDTIR